MFQLTRFSHSTVFSRNQNARYAGTGCTGGPSLTHSRYIIIVLYKSNLSSRPGFSLIYLGSLSSNKNEFKITISFEIAHPFKNPGPSADLITIFFGMKIAINFI